MTKKILLLGNSAAGIYNFRKELLQALVDAGYQVAVSVPEAEHVENIRELGCACLPTPIERRGTNPVKDLGLLRLYLRMMKREKPDVVLTYTIKPNIYGGLCARILRIPYIANITGLGTTFEKEGLLQSLVVCMYRTALKKASCIFFQNRQNRQLFADKGIKGRNSRLINGSGVNLERHFEEPYPCHEKPMLLYVGRIMQEKGMDEFLSCAERLWDMAEFGIIGYCEEAYEERIRTLQETGKLHFYGYQKDVHPFLREADAVVMPSYHEGMSNVILEAAATGRPALASDISGCREAFEDGVTGIGFAPKDKSALEAAIRRFVSMKPEERAAMGHAAREKMEREFDRGQVVAAYLEEIGRAGDGRNCRA